MTRVDVQRRLNERPEHPLHDHLYPLVEALQAFHAAILQAAIPWTSQMHREVHCYCLTITCRDGLVYQHTCFLYHCARKVFSHI